MYKSVSAGLFLLVMITTCIIFIVAKKCSDDNNKREIQKECYRELNRHVSGVVSNAYYDDNINVKAFVIYFTNGEKYVNPIFLKSLNGYVMEGDSIYKVLGTFKFKIFKKGNVKPVTIEDTVNCNRLK